MVTERQSTCGETLYVLSEAALAVQHTPGSFQQHTAWLCVQTSSKHFFKIEVLLLPLLLQSALQPLVGFGLLYDFIPQSSIFKLLSPISHFHLL